MSYAARIVADSVGPHGSRLTTIVATFPRFTALITATEWSNFFALRDHPGAQPEFQIIARMMREAMESSRPREVEYGWWHLPFTRAGEMVDFVPGDRKDFWPLVSAGRCFVVSYDRLDEIEDEDPIRGFERADKGKGIGHWSPLEHPAVCCEPHMNGLFPSHCDRYANFVGWRQLSSHYPYESDFAGLLASAPA